MEYIAYDELMSYFQFAFNGYIALFVIVLVGLLKTLLVYTNSKKIGDIKNIHSNKNLYDLTISLLAIIGLINALFFQGVMSDIPLESGHVWINKTMYLLMGSIVLFSVQIIFIILTNIRIRKLKKGL